MKRCSKCDVEKELDEFDRYFHRKQNRERIRGYCKSCFRLQKKQYKESIKNKKIIPPVEDMTPPEVFEPVYDTTIFKKCKECQEWKLIEVDYYRHSKKFPNARCKECERKIETEKYYQEIEDNGGHDRCPVKVGVYCDEIQESQTKEFLTLLGWKQNSSGTWWKEGFKTEEGIWIKRNNNGRRKREFTLENTPDIKNPNHLNKRVFDNDIIDGIMDMYNEGKSFPKIMERFKLSKYLICRIINEHLQSK